MVDKLGHYTKAEMSAAERVQRSRIIQLLQGAGLVRGSLLTRERRCGKPRCHCASGPGHLSLVVQFSREGRCRQVLVPKSMEAEVRCWVEQYHEVRERLEKISEIYQEKMRRAKRKRAKKED